MNIGALLHKFGSPVKTDEGWPHSRFLKEADQVERPQCQFPSHKPASAYSYKCRCNECQLIWYMYGQLRKWSVINGYMPQRNTGRGKRVANPLVDTECALCNKPMKRRSDRAYEICMHCVGDHPSVVRRMKKAGIPVERILHVLRSRTCEICEQRLEGLSGKSWNLDHDHKVDERITARSFRGVLCSRCNTLVGYIEKTPELVEPIKHYLIRHAERSRNGC